MPNYRDMKYQKYSNKKYKTFGVRHIWDQTQIHNYYLDALDK